MLSSLSYYILLPYHYHYHYHIIAIIILLLLHSHDLSSMTSLPSQRWGQRVHVRLVVVAADCSGSTSDGKIQTFSAQGMADIVMTSSNLAQDNLGYKYIIT